MGGGHGYSAPASKQDPDFGFKPRSRLAVAQEAQERMMGYKHERDRQLAELQRRKEE